MHIGFDVAPITRTRTGVGNYCFYLLKHLLSLAGNGSFTGFSAGRSPVDLGELGDGLPFRRIPIPARVLYALWDRSLFPPLDRLLRGLDVYHATNYFLPPAGRAKRALTIHDLAHLAVPEVCDPRIVKPFATGLRRFAGETECMRERWSAVLDDDPAYSPNLTLVGNDFSLASPPRNTIAQAVQG